MRKIILAITIVLPQALYGDEAADHCQQWFDLAKQIMTDRQSGRDMPEMLREAGSLPESQREIGRMMVSRAFELPLYRTERRQQEMIHQYSNGAFAVCYKD